MSDNGKHLGRVIDDLLAEACGHAASRERVPLSGLAARVERHAAEVRQAGGSALEALDSALVAALFAGEAMALAQKPEGDPGHDPHGVRPVADRMRSYPDAVRQRAAAGVCRLPVNSRRNLQLMTTRRCQLRCTYCPVIKGTADMPREVIERAVDLLLGSGSDEIRLDFSGGEPLLRSEEVLRAADRLLDGASARGKRASSYMVTNGFLLTPALAADLAARGFRVELSLDGPENMHNRHKVLEPGSSGGSPYRSTVAAIRAALDAGLPCTVVMVASPDTVDLLGSSFEHALGLGVRSLDVNYAVGRRWQGEAGRSFMRALAAIVMDHADDLAAGRLSIGNLSSKVEPAILNAEWMVDTDGGIHLMTEWALESSRDPGAPAMSSGNVRDKVRWDDLYAGRFHAYLALLRSYAWRSAALRTVVHDNVRMGRAVSRCLAEARP